MRILYLANVRLPTEKAHGLQIIETCAAFARAGHEVTLAVSAWSSSSEEEIFSYYKIPKNFWIRLISGGIFYRLGSSGFVLGSLIFKHTIRKEFDLNSFDSVYTRDDILVDDGFFYEMHDVRGSYQKRALMRAKGIVAISKGLADYCSSIGIDPKKIQIAPDAVDLNAFVIQENKIECRKKLGLPIDKKIALYAGHLYSWKGADVFARAAESLPSDSLAVFVGGTDHDLVSFKSEFGSNPKIQILGRKPHELIPYYLKAADILVLPNSAKEAISRLYTSPLKLFEYMASGTPIVVSDLPSIREILSDSNAVFAKPDDSTDLTEKISQLFNDSNLASRLSSQAFRDVQAYSWSSRASKIADFISHSQAKKVKDQVFYDKASISYSESRYPEKSTDYNHFFFKRRLSITVGMLHNALRRLRSPSLLEVGCADGIVLKRIYEEFGKAIASYTGIDTSPKMIEAAKAKLVSTPVSFLVRNSNGEFDGHKHNLIVEIGVLNYADFDADMDCANRSVTERGYYICSVAGKGSLWDKLIRVDKGFGNFRTYKEYEAKMKEYFAIVDVKPVGLRVPFIWRFPPMARVIQPVAEALFGLVPNAFHEKIYLLSKPRVQPNLKE